MHVPPRRTPRGTRLQADAGLGLIEVVVAMVVFGVIATGIVSSLMITFRMTPDNEAREVAANLAAQEVDLVRAIGDPYKVGARTTTQTINGRVYTIARTSGWLQPNGVSGTCGQSSANFELKVDVDVSWAGQSSTTRDIRSDTLLAPLSTLSNSSTGALAIYVQDANDLAPLSGASLTVSPAASNPDGAQTPMAQPAVTGTDGCSYVAKLAPGNYDVSATVSGPGGATNGSTKGVAVAAGTTSSTVVQLSGTGALVPDPADNIAGLQVLPTALTVSYFNKDRTYAVSAAASVPAATDSNGYTAVAGKVGAVGTATQTCPELDPAEWGAGPSGGKQLANGQREAAVPLPTPRSRKIGVPMGTVTLRGLDGMYVKAVQSVPTGDGNPGCSSANAVLQFPQITDDEVEIALPYGSWTLYEGPIALLQVIPVLPTQIAATSNAAGGGVLLNEVTLDPRPLR